MAKNQTLKLFVGGLLLASMAAPMIGCVTGSTTRGPKPSPSSGTSSTGSNTSTTGSSSTSTGTASTGNTSNTTGTTATTTGTTATTSSTGFATSTSNTSAGNTTGTVLSQSAFQHAIANATNIFDVTADASNVYWTEKVANNSFVMALRKDGTQSTPTVLAAGSAANLAWGIATDGSNVYFTTNQGGSAGTVESVPVGEGATPTTLVSGLNSPTFVRLASDGRLYVAQNGAGDGAVLRFDAHAAGQTAASGAFISTPGATPYNVRVFDVAGIPTVFYTTMSENLGGSGAVYAGSTLVASGLINPTDVAYDASNNTVYWTEYDAANGGVRAQSLAAAGGRGSLLASVANAAALLGGNGSLVVTRNAAADAGGAVLSVDEASGAQSVLARTSANYPFQIFGDANGYYVTEFNFSQGANGASLAGSELLVVR